MVIIELHESNVIPESASNIWVVLILTYILIRATLEDIESYKVSNRLFVLGWGASFFIAICWYGAVGIPYWAASVLVPVLITVPIFIVKGLGGADVKAFSVVGGFIGLYLGLRVIFVSFFIGALISLIKLIFSGKFLNRLQGLAEYFKLILLTRRYVPYENTIIADESRMHFMIPIFIAVVVVQVLY